VSASAAAPGSASGSSRKPKTAGRTISSFTAARLVFDSAVALRASDGYRRRSVPNACGTWNVAWPVGRQA
jgi:hypothetical protein